MRSHTSCIPCNVLRKLKNVFDETSNYRPIIYTRLSISILYAPFNYLRNRYTTTIFTLRDNASTRKLTQNRIKGTTLTVPEDLKEKWKCEFNERKNKHQTCQLSNISTTFNIISYVSSDDVCMVSFSIL